jgi:hypothetical protein
MPVPTPTGHNIPLRPRGGASHDDVRIVLTQASTAPLVLRPTS